MNEPNNVPNVQRLISSGPELPRYSFSQVIPEQYNCTYIQCIPVNPETVFVFWELDHNDRITISKRLQINIETVTFILRLSDVTDIMYDGTNAWNYTDHTVDSHTQKIYIPVPEPDRSYIAELGISLTDSPFYSLLRSISFMAPHRPIQIRSDQDSDIWDNSDNVFINDAESESYINTPDLESYNSSTIPYLGSGSFDHS